MIYIFIIFLIELLVIYLVLRLLYAVAGKFVWLCNTLRTIFYILFSIGLFIIVTVEAVSLSGRYPSILNYGGFFLIVGIIGAIVFRKPKPPKIRPG